MTNQGNHLTQVPSYFNYWGKAKKEPDSEGADYHLLPYHCLDVAAVAAYWWDNSRSLQTLFATSVNLPTNQLRAWVLFFVALHDLGKLDIRFQCKSRDSWLTLNPETPSTLPSVNECKTFDHGKAGLYWFSEDWKQQPSANTGDLDSLLDMSFEHPYQSWFAWLEAVTGHHGYVIDWEQVLNHRMPPHYSFAMENDRLARRKWIEQLETLFLAPESLSIADHPPSAPPLLAGFCSISDWLGSWVTDDTFCYRSQSCDNEADLLQYFMEKYQGDAATVFQRSGMLGHAMPYRGIEALLDKGHSARQLQVLVDQLPSQPGLTIVEAPTGSGKTETALAYAWRLIDHGLADSIIFALPTQATANAMLERLDRLADKLFVKPNLILAHGHSRFNKEFTAIKQRGRNAQQSQEAWSQCCEWLAQSRKRVFLGQIGVCTIDQVLVSVLPVRHRFVRGFGIGRSILIIDEVHAYDTYMYGLLEEVLKEQHRAGNSAILLSATLPAQKKQKLLVTYGVGNGEKAPAHYPLVAWRQNQADSHFHLTDRPEHLPKPVTLSIEPYHTNDSLPDSTLLNRMIEAARNGAQVCLVSNLVDVAQMIYQQLKMTCDLKITLFHARFTLIDRQRIEESVLNHFGPDGDRQNGHILIATQVVEQSLDLDFDWMITQLCPVDLLFQRIGRLHRHPQASRPQGFEYPSATVLLPIEEGYGNYGAIYANTLVMWRTQQKIESLAGKALAFPDAYRSWIEPVYQAELDGTEPEWVIAGYDDFDTKELEKRSKARQMLQWAHNAIPLNDDDSNIRAVTRDGEMSLPVIPYINVANGKQLLDGRILESLSEFERQEALALNRINVPQSWKKWLLQECDDEGISWLPGRSTLESHEFKGKETMIFHYNNKIGMEKINEPLNR